MRELTYVPTIRDMLDNSAEKFGNKSFIKYVENGKVVEKSFIQVREDSLAICRYLRNLSKEKLHIALVGKTSYEYIILATGILISGNVLIPFAPEISEKEAKSLFARADVNFIVHDGALSDRIEGIAAEVKTVAPPLCISSSECAEKIYRDFSSDSEYASLSDFKVDENEPAIMIYTSGTTGIKKAVVHSTKSFAANVMYTDLVEYVSDEASTLSVLPMYHVFCFSGDYVRNLRDGLPLAINGNMRDLAQNLKIFQPSVMRIVPMVAQTLLKMIRATMSKNPSLTPRQAAESVYGKNIEWLFSGGAYLSPELASEYTQFGIFLKQGYGMTEAGCRVTVPDERCSFESVGRVIDICEVRIVGGEIQIKTPSVMLGYYKMPEETAKMFTDDGWLRTGDIGYLTEDNELYVTGRLKNLIILSGGENVSPEAIEKKFNEYEIVSEVLVYGENDQIVAEVYPNYDYCEENGIDDPMDSITTIVRHLNSTSKASHLISKTVIRKEPLEKTESGKIKRRETII